MIILIPVDINRLLEEKKKYNWPKPESCPNCSNKAFWGHGYVDALFDFATVAVPLKRYLCLGCLRPIKMKPEGYFKRFQATIETIGSSIEKKVFEDKPIKGVSRQRQRHWFAALKRRAVAIFGLGADLIEAFKELMAAGTIPVSRSFNGGKQAFH